MCAISNKKPMCAKVRGSARKAFRWSGMRATLKTPVRPNLCMVPALPNIPNKRSLTTFDLGTHRPFLLILITPDVFPFSCFALDRLAPLLRPHTPFLLS